MLEKTLYWTPRILSIMAIGFMLMFSLDVFEGNESFLRKAGGFFMHNIPVLVLVLILSVAWKRELIGGILFCAAFIGASILFRSFAGNKGSLIITLPFLLTGLLFIIHHILYKRPENIRE